MTVKNPQLLTKCVSCPSMIDGLKKRCFPCRQKMKKAYYVRVQKPKLKAQKIAQKKKLDTIFNSKFT